MNNSVGEYTDAGAVSFGGTQAASANFRTITAFDGWPPELGRYVRVEVANSMAESIVRIQRELEEAQAQIAVYEAERSILSAELRQLREEVAKYRAMQPDDDDYVQLTPKGIALLEGRL